MAENNEKDMQMQWWSDQLKDLSPQQLRKVKRLLARELWSRWMRTLSGKEIKYLLRIIKNLED